MSSPAQGIGHRDTNELLRAQYMVFSQTFGFMKSAMLKCAIQLRIPDLIYEQGRPMTLPELVHATRINQEKRRPFQGHWTNGSSRTQTEFPLVSPVSPL
ncbi:hypothetical protein MLD38_037448 [Melastoma candidum]|uniref:Uncharacterized protein n=1 Tax=Melastoma candidum TaxID=119954 RepID=A0ACB9LMQ6_9MYRT|nr:hypothetical protein MLD38_037448 [Melastoma candidum]